MRFLTTNVVPRPFTYNFFDEVEKILGGTERSWLPTHFKEEDNQYLLSIDLPGVAKEDIKIDLKENSLTVSGERKNVGTFERAFTLPNYVDIENVKATYENGVLEFVLPKAEAAKPRRLEISPK